MEDAARPVTGDAPRTGAASSTTAAILSDIRFEQTLFSMPFAFLAMLLAAGGWPETRVLVLIVIAVVAARSGAMSMNRVADSAIDARNPRTAGRAIPSGRVRRGVMVTFAVLSLAVLAVAAWLLNPLCLALCPVALLFLVGYSWTKRFTPLCHLVLGATIGIAPLGAWVAVRGDFLADGGGVDPTPWALWAAVTAWVAGFDILYACPDAEVDRRDGLHSAPRALGVRTAFLVAALLHTVTLGALAWAGLASEPLGGLWWAGVAAGAVVLGIEHTLVRPGRYERMATAFFRMNALFGLLLLAAGAADVFRS